MNRFLAVAVLAIAGVGVGCHHNHDDHKHHNHSHKDSHSSAGQLQAAPVMASMQASPAVSVSAAAPATQPAKADGAKVVTAGAPMTVTSAPVPVSEVLANPEKYAGSPIKISGNVSSVCVKKGCWARLSDDKTPAGSDLFVKFDCPEADDGRVLPMSVQGNQAIVEGTVKVTEMSEAKARHYAKDAGKSDAEVNKIVGPQKTVTVSSPAVQVTVK